MLRPGDVKPKIEASTREPGLASGDDEAQVHLASV